ncbi:hypothetical protein TSACC_2340 [Terrimicrobium sacchariphilum]|uniref:DUF1501 domain-containing protein n=1 Tax=Terrimicrobium sacchariphilum TaxID=690879 RepID=A0A146G288_TERSA|nr:DUF1501 domain-containing protein [Terrimicrobium sacchariphilum]GAT31945.1 hypothetical protein TSACC_2340 [Terrimicrobium sacchariphilum]
MSDEQTLRTRRQFLRTGVLGGAMAWTLPAFIEKTFFALDAAAADSALQVATGKDSPILVILQMAGGNDGLNMVVPYGDDAYYRARPKIGLAAGNVLKVDDHIGLHPRLKTLRGFYDEGRLGVIQGVGYPNPNRSHFRSTDIWQTATDSNKFANKGWLANYFDSCCKGEDPVVGVSIGSETPLSFSGSAGAGITLSRPDQFRFISNDPAAGEAFADMTSLSDNTGGSVQSLSGDKAQGDGNTLDFVRRTALDARISSDRILEITRKSKAPVSYPGGRLATDLNLVARLIAGGLPTRVYYVSQGGYDTHSGQLGSHDRLLGELDSSLGAFVADLKAQGNLDRVTIMTFSEFGRRVAENASGGTDHGAAAPMFVLGGKVKAGLHGTQPSLTELGDGDLIYTVDFRSVYATMLDKWLHAPSEAVLGRKFPSLGFV